MHVVVVGAGIVGAAVAYRLAANGHAVSLVERADAPAAGVTAHAFGWINVVAGYPTDETVIRLRMDAMEDFARLREEVPHAFAEARNGAILWDETIQETMDAIDRFASIGVALDLLDPKRFAELEPNLVDYPAVAIHAADDIAITPAVLAGELVKAAVSLGARFLRGARVERLRVHGATVLGVETDSGFVAADRVVLTSGVKVDDLLAPFGAALGVYGSPAVLLRFHAPGVRIGRILQGARVEVRPIADGCLAVAEDMPGDGDLDRLARESTRALEDMFGLHGHVRWLSTDVGYRPRFNDGLPRCGPVEGLRRCHVAVGHPGVILAPLLARRIAAVLAA